jgi:hypothetical protein
MMHWRRIRSATLQIFDVEVLLAAGMSCWALAVAVYRHLSLTQECACRAAVVTVVGTAVIPLALKPGAHLASELGTHALPARSALSLEA